MTRIAGGAVIIHTTAESAPSPPSCFGEVTLMAAYLLEKAFQLFFQGVLQYLSYLLIRFHV